MSLHTASRGDSELSLSQERVKCAVVDGSEVMVRPSYDPDAHIMVLTVCRRAPVLIYSTASSHLYSMTRHTASRGDSELSLFQERVQCAVADGSDLMVRPSYGLDARIMVLMIRRRAPAPHRDLSQP